MENATNPLQATNKRAPNKGFKIWVGDTYIGYLNIGEKNTPPKDVESLQKPAVMKAILAKATLKAYEPDVARDMSGVSDIITTAEIALMEDTISSNAE